MPRKRNGRPMKFGKKAQPTKTYTAEEQAAIDQWLADPANVKRMLEAKEERLKHIWDPAPDVKGSRY